ncbi:MAG TPA: histone deacetylase [Verrucomicrobiae bacterium]|nr:histone deacetylase [Verrucomicrobiae bacterium]
MFIPVPIMKVITDERCTGYAQSGHPERPGRITGTLKKLREQTGLPIEWLTPEAVTDESILRAHTTEMVARLKEPVDFDGDTPFFPDIEQHAKRSVGAALTALRLARNGDMAFSLMRPPGHHATRHKSMGFCYLNNIAIAALEALATGVKRVAVYDFDVHHGNGTEDILLNHPGAAFFSVHQYPAYPGTGGSNVGNNCFNFPVVPRMPRGDYREVLSSAIDAMKRFKPEIIGVSAGFDAYARDPLAEETLEAEDFHWLGQSLRGLNVPVFSLLEGGYSSHLPELVLAYLRGVAGK